MQQLLRKRGVQGFVAGGLAAGLFAAGAAWAGGLAPPVKVSGGAQRMRFRNRSFELSDSFGVASNLTAS